MKVELHIERLVLSGLDASPAEHRRLASSLESELSRLIQEQPFSERARHAELASTHAPAVVLTTPFNPTSAGTELARSLYASLAGALVPGARDA